MPKNVTTKKAGTARKTADYFEGVSLELEKIIEADPDGKDVVYVNPRYTNAGVQERIVQLSMQYKHSLLDSQATTRERDAAEEQIKIEKRYSLTLERMLEELDEDDN